MRDLDRIAQHENLLKVRQLLMATAGADVLDARTRENERRREADDARSRADGAMQAWLDHFSARNPDLTQLNGLGHALTLCDVQARSAADRLQRTGDRTAGAEQHHAACKVRTAQAEDSLEQLHRRERQERAESAMATLEDRIAYAWVKA